MFFSCMGWDWPYPCTHICFPAHAPLIQAATCSDGADADTALVFDGLTALPNHSTSYLRESMSLQVLLEQMQPPPSSALDGGAGDGGSDGGGGGDDDEEDDDDDDDDGGGGGRRKSMVRSWAGWHVPGELAGA